MLIVHRFEMALTRFDGTNAWFWWHKEIYYFTLEWHETSCIFQVKLPKYQKFEVDYKIRRVIDTLFVS